MARNPRSAALVVRGRTDIRNPAELYLLSLDPKQSQSAMRGALNTVCALAGTPRQEEQSAKGGRRNITYRFFPWERLRMEHVMALRARMIEAGYAPASCNKMLQGIISVLKYARKLRLIDRDDYEEAIDIEWVPGRGLPSGVKRRLSREEFDRLLVAGRSDGSNAARLRNDAILWLLYGTGARRGELIARPNQEQTFDGLTLDRYNRDHKTLHLSGKGGAERLVPLEGGAFEGLEAWLAVRGSWPGPIFCQLKSNGFVLPDPVREGRVYDIVVARAHAATPPVKNVSPHTFRRTFITDLLSNGVPDAFVADLVGHIDTNTTRKYSYPSEETLRAQVKLRDIDYLSHGAMLVQDAP